MESLKDRKRSEVLYSSGGDRAGRARATALAGVCSALALALALALT